MWSEMLAVATLMVLTGLSIGLYLGERGRRQALERQLVTGNPMGTRAEVRAPEVEPEERIAKVGQPARDYEVSRKTIKNGIRSVMQEAQRQGQKMSEAEAERQVLAMLHPDYNPDAQL